MMYLRTLHHGTAKLTPATCDLYPDSVGFLLLEDFPYTHNGQQFLVPAGFWFNGASIPAPFWQLICSPFDPRILERALIHDWLYTAKILKKSDADKLLITDISGMAEWRKDAIYRAVNLFGGFAWDDSQTDRLYVSMFMKQLEWDGRKWATYTNPV